MEHQSINDFALDGEEQEELRPMFQMVRRLWARYRATNLERIAAAIECGQLLENLNKRLPYGEFGKVLAWAEMPERTARMWRQLAVTGLNAAQVIEAGGIAKATLGVSLSDVEIASSAMPDTPIAEPHKEEPQPTITNDDNVPPPYFPEMEFEEGEEPVPQTAEKAMAEVPAKMEEPVKKPSNWNCFRSKLPSLKGELTSIPP